MGKSVIAPGNIIIYWAPSCSSGAEEYGIYQGSIGFWTSHRWKFCTDVDGVPLSETFPPGNASSYYLVVPHNFVEEGAYGLDYDPNRTPSRIERLPPTLNTDRCVPSHVVTPCPP